MPREVTHDAHGPRYLTEADIDEEKGDIAICMCGLSDEYPFCDGSHRTTADEDEDVRYKYEDDDDANERHEIVEMVFAEDVSRDT